jgi:hypothetical protein
MGRGGHNTMGRGFDIPYAVGSKYHGYTWIKNTAK